MWNCIAKTCRTKLLGTPLLKTHRRVSAKCVTYSGTAWKFQQAQGNALLHWDVVCRYSSMKTHFQLTSSRTNFNTLHEKHLCGTKILGTQLFRTTQMCQGSTCHVVAQHGDISKLNKALLLTCEVCATIAIKTSKKISMLFQKTQGKEGKPRKATFVAQRFLGHNCWLPRCAHVRLPRYMPKRTYMSIRTAARDPDSGQGQRACLLAQHVLSKGWTKQLYWLGKLCKFANLTYDFCDLRCHLGDEM